jgi:glycosyltransferase involved in cell wall biosynthesis
LLGLDGFDVIHLHYPFIFGAEMIWALSKMRGVPYVITYHNDLIGDGLRRWVFGAYSAISTRLVFGRARKFAVVSLDHAASCRAAPLFRRRWTDVVQISNGVDTDVFRPGLDGTSVRRQYGIQASDRVVLFVGALDRAHHFKGVPSLLGAVSLLQDPRTVLMIVGEGDLEAHYAQTARELGVGERTRFVGAKSPEQLARYYAAAEVVVLPSLPPESFGMVLIEAMACSRPVIASDLPGVRTVVSDGQDGLLVRPGDVQDITAKIRQLVDSPRQRQEMGSKGRAKVEATYAWDKIVPKLERVYEDALSPTVGLSNGRSWRRRSVR